jgi:hypothetical protein
MNHDFSILTDAFASLASVWIRPCLVYFPTKLADQGGDITGWSAPFHICGIDMMHDRFV